jgi:hypothetical protein
MKKSCDGCKAIGFGCHLGKKVQTVYKTTYNGYVISYQIPAEECPKPKTNKEFLELLNLKK